MEKIKINQQRFNLFSILYVCFFFRRRQIGRQMFGIKNICSTLQIILLKQQKSNLKIYIFLSFATHPQAVVKLHLAGASSVDFFHWSNLESSLPSCAPPCHFPLPPLSLIFSTLIKLHQFTLTDGMKRILNLLKVKTYHLLRTLPDWRDATTGRQGNLQYLQSMSYNCSQIFW